MKFKREIGAVLFVSGLFLIALLSVHLGIIDLLFFREKADHKILSASVFLHWFVCCSVAPIIVNWKKLWKNILLSFVSFTLMFIIGEIALKIIYPSKSRVGFKMMRSRQYHHVCPKNRSMYSTSGDFVVNTNEDGLRSKYSRKTFLQFQERIMMLGDSFTFGSGVEGENTFSSFVERQLRKKFKRDDIAVLNAGVISNSPFLEKIKFEGKLKYYRPDIVMLFLDATDIGDDCMYMSEAKQDKDGIVYFPYAKRKQAQYPSYYGYVYEVLFGEIYGQFKWYKKRFLYPYALVSNLLDPDYKDDYKDDYNYYNYPQTKIKDFVATNRFFIYRHPLEDTEVYFRTSLKNISSIAEKAKAIGADFILVVTPRYHHWSSKECPNNWEKEEYSNNEPYQYEYFRFFEKIRDEVDYDIYNMLPDFQQTNEFPIVFDFDPHWNVKGHRFVAKLITKYLQTYYNWEQKDKTI